MSLRTPGKSHCALSYRGCRSPRDARTGGRSHHAPRGVGQVGGAAGRGGRCARVRAPPTRGPDLAQAYSALAPGPGFCAAATTGSLFSWVSDEWDRRRGRPGPAETCRRRPERMLWGRNAATQSSPTTAWAWSWVLSVLPRTRGARQRHSVLQSPLRGSARPPGYVPP